MCTLLKFLNIGDKFVFKNRKTIYIYEGYDDLSDAYICFDSYRWNILYTDGNRKVEIIKY